MSSAVVLLLSTTLTAVLAQRFNYVAAPLGSPTTCATPQGQRGVCVLLKDCPHLLNLFRTSRTFQTRQLLETLTCGSETRYPKVCCSDNQIPASPNPPPPGPTPRTITRPNPRRPPVTTVAPRVSMLPMVEGQASGPDNLLQHRNIGQLPLENCGLEFVSKIYGGNDTKLGEFPWAALLAYENIGGDGTRTFECGGALINQRYVLTAAHCTNKGNIRMKKLVGVRLGEHDITKNPDCEPDETCQLTGRANCADYCASEPLDFGIEEEVVHPEYVSASRNQFHDIALLRLSSTVSFTGDVRPVCIPTNVNLARKSYAGSNLTATGWGRTTSGTKSPVKLKADLPAVPREECAPLYARTRRNITALQMCAGGVPGVDVCSGDSGGPLMAFEMVNGNFRSHVMGIVSYGSSMCHFGIPGVYTKVAAYASWILDQLRP